MRNLKVKGQFFFLLALQPQVGVVFYSLLVGFSLLAKGQFNNANVMTSNGKQKNK